MTQRAGSWCPPVILASPVGQPPSPRHSARRPGPAARWMAPSTPPPPSSELLAALTMASTSWTVMSPWTTSIIAIAGVHPFISGYRIGLLDHQEGCLVGAGLRARPLSLPDDWVVNQQGGHGDPPLR